MTAAILAAHPGRHRRPPLHRRIAASLRTFRQRRAVEEARDDAYLVRIEPHAPPPLVVAQARVAALYGALHPDQGPPVLTVTDGFNQPPAAVQPDRDVPGMEHLRRPWDDWPTGTFAAQAREWSDGAP